MRDMQQWSSGFPFFLGAQCGWRRNALKRDPLVRRPDLAIFIVIFKLVRGKVALFVFSMSIVAEGDKVEGEVLEAFSML